MNSIYVGYFDIVIILIMVVGNIYVLKKRGVLSFNAGCILLIIVFGFLLPFISMAIEIEIVSSTKGIMDNFEVAYTFLRFPLYWFLGIIQSVLLRIIISRSKEYQKIQDSEN